MALSEDLINFDLIETHKENIQSLPGGRSAKQLVSILSPLPSSKTGSEPTFNETKTLNDVIRQEYETELLSIADSDDPLDIYDRYVKWTLNAYPSAQATPHSQLLTLLERATKTFLTSSHYKNDPRYLKLWLHYIRLFSDTPRETFAFLARHHIGETLGLFYEEFAAWLEGAGRWNQADEVYRMGIEREARPAERLMRKYNQFQQRYEARPQEVNEPSSPALPTVRPALAAKLDPFAATSRANEPQGQRSGSSGSTAKPKSGKQKMAIFNDAESEAPPPASVTTKGWDSIGSVRERKKENVIEAKPWAGETLKAGKRVGTVPKMEIFKDPSIQINETKKVSSSRSTDAVNPRTGRSERVFVDLEAIYPNDSEEYSFEELRALRRGWMERDWRAERMALMQVAETNVEPSHQPYRSTESDDVENLTRSFLEKVDLHEVSTQSIAGMPEPKPVKQKKLKHREIKQQVQTVKTRLDSPTGKKVKRKASATAEPTMTFHSKAAMNDIYNIFNHSKKETPREEVQSGDETDRDEDTYSIAGESVGTGRISGNNSEYGDDTTRSLGFDNADSQSYSESPWSDFTLSNPLPKSKARSKSKHKKQLSDDLTEDFDSSQNQTMGCFDTQAIDALAHQDFGDLDTKMIAQLAGDIAEDEERESSEEEDNGECGEDADASNKEISPRTNDADTHGPRALMKTQDLKTPVEECFIHAELIEVKEKPRFVPIPPEDYEPTPLRPFRDPLAMAHNKLPFMTPIVERTESSLAPSTIFQNPDYFTSKTPSKSEIDGSRTDSPSRLQIDDLLLSSPAQDSPWSSKRRRSIEVPRKEDNKEGSPPKKHITELSVCDNIAIPFTVTKPVAVLAPTPALEPVVGEPSMPTAIHNDDIFSASPVILKKVPEQTRPIHKGPIVLDLQCNPCDETVRKQILDTVHPAICTYEGYFDSSEQSFNHHNVLKTYAAKQKKDTAKSSPRKSQNEKTLTKAVPPVLEFRGTDRVYAIKKELGKGAYAPVYLVDSYIMVEKEDSTSTSNGENETKPYSADSRGELEAVKTESPPLTLVWEFHILQLAKARLGSGSRTMCSIIKAQECHLYRDECYLVLNYHHQGTLLDLVNLVRADNARAGKTAEGLEETVAMWLSVELLRTMDDIWRVGLLHGDLKIDNCLARFNTDEDTAAPFSRNGTNGWSSKGLVLIDFGRGIDCKAFKPEAKFVADWKAEETDCAEIREARPWKYEIDLFGAAGIIHSLLFGKYVETIPAGGGGLGQKKEWKLRDNLKRYWERDIWGEVFGLLINGGKLNDVDEVRKEVTRVRCMMEDWLETESERGGRDLRGAIRRCERLIKSR